MHTRTVCWRTWPEWGPKGMLLKRVFCFCWKQRTRGSRKILTLAHQLTLKTWPVGWHHKPSTLGTSRKWAIQYSSFCVWLITWSISSSSFVLLKGVNISFLCKAEKCSTAWRPSFVYSLTRDGHLGCFNFLTTRNNAAMHMCVHYLFETLLSVLLGRYLEAESLGHTENLLYFEE